MAMTDSEIYEEVRPIVVDALGVEQEEVALQSRLMDDLGAESIDFLDVFFRVERVFGVKLDTSASAAMNDERFVREGAVTDEGMEELRRRLPGVDLSQVEQSRKLQDIEKAFTVASIVEMVKARLAEAATAT